jgi:hypothetical protein
LSGTIRSGGDFDGAISVGGDLPGEIRIDGSLKNSEAEFEVDVVGSAEASGAIAVDYDGFDANQDWESGAVVRIDGEEYVEASDAVNYLYEAPNIWHVTECVGDCNNDAVLDAFDVEPFTVALTGEAQYATAYPGLGGSRVHHADIDCSGVVDAFDIEPFINQLLIGCGQMCIAPRPAGGWPIVAVLSLRTGLVNSVFAIPSACDPFDDKADRMIALFQEHVSARHHTTLANECAFLSAYYWEAGQTRRSEMFLRVSSALSE